jgi:DNA (cytosine-5)-methyltransferase 1
LSYLDILESAWLDHLKPKAPDAPTVISTFAGGGGSSLGYSMAGYRELLAVEWDGNAVATFKLNFPEVPVYRGDIAKLSVEECLKLAGIQPGELDLFDGSPPCQGFSIAGKRILDDPRNQLFREYVRLLRGLKPKVFVMENVSGMVKGKMKLVFAEIMRELKASGYRVSARLMNAMYFNVPQSRQRMIFIGVREDLGIEPSHPKGESRGISPNIAFADCPEEEIKPLPDWLKEAARYIDAGNYNHQSVERAFLRVRGKSAGSQNTKLLSWNRVSCTLVKSEISVTGVIHPDRERYLTIAEMKRIASFPDKFQFIGERKDKVSRIGNSVPPLFLRSIALYIRREILDKLTTRDPIRLSE